MMDLWLFSETKLRTKFDTICCSNSINFYERNDIDISLSTNGDNSFAVVLENNSGHDLYLQNGMFYFIGLETEQ